jgi:hypothetical protein
MTDQNARIKALEDTLAEMEITLQKTQAYISKMDDTYYKMMKNALHKYGVLKEFCETAGPIIIACDNALFPEKAAARAKRLAFVLKSDEGEVSQ